MRNAMKDICKLLAPPASPRGLDRTWNDVESEIGLSLPDDYKAFIDVYGSGQITGAAGWINVWNLRDSSLFRSPLSSDPGGLSSVLREYQSLDATDFRCPFPIYPAPAGLLPFASVMDVHFLNWLTDGPPSQWAVVYYDFDGCEFNLLTGESFSDCILKMLRQEYTGLEQPSGLKPPCEFTDFKIR